MKPTTAQPIESGGPAFPRAGHWPAGTNGDAVEKCPTINEPQDGMTLRDYFAAKAMVGLIEGYDFEVRERSANKADRTGFDEQPHAADSDATYASQMAEEAYVIADAMLSAREPGTVIDAKSREQLLSACKFVRDELLKPMARNWPGTMSITARTVEDVLGVAIAKAEGRAG